MSKWPENQTQVPVKQWREAEDRASKHRMRADALADTVAAQNRAALAFAVVCGMWDAPNQPTARDIQNLSKEFGWTQPGTERDIQAKRQTRPHLTPADIENAIVSEEIFTAVHGLHGKYKNVGLHGDSPLHNVTICVLVLEDCSTASGVSHGLPAIEAATEARALAVASAVQRWNSRQ